MFRFTLLFLLLSTAHPVIGFTATVDVSRNHCAHHSTRLSPLFMGRAAAVRAATKSKTDARKAKINAVFGKRIIMAVKQVREYCAWKTHAQFHRETWNTDATDLTSCPCFYMFA